MLTRAQFLEVYELLDRGMVDVDCGIRCERFCCTGAAVKYLLPGEELLFAPSHPELPLLDKPWYLQVVQDTCSCVREHRMFACRAFPFRPVLAPDSFAVVGLRKVQNATFAPCWVEQPLPDWRTRAIDAWGIVVGDLDNRRLYGRIHFLRELLDRLGDRFFDIPADQIDTFLEGEIQKVDPDEMESRGHAYFE